MFISVTNVPPWCGMLIKREAVHVGGQGGIREFYVFQSIFALNLIRSDQISRSVVSDSLRPHESQHARPPCPSPTPKRGVGKDASKPMKFQGSTL